MIHTPVRIIIRLACSMVGPAQQLFRIRFIILVPQQALPVRLSPFPTALFESRDSGFHLYYGLFSAPGRERGGSGDVPGIPCPAVLQVGLIGFRGITPGPTPPFLRIHTGIQGKKRRGVLTRLRARLIILGW